MSRVTNFYIGMVTILWHLGSQKFCKKIYNDDKQIKLTLSQKTLIWQ